MPKNHNQRLFPGCYFWRSHRKQEVDYLEELNGAAYPDCPVSLINRENMTGFVTG